MFNNLKKLLLIVLGVILVIVAMISKNPYLLETDTEVLTENKDITSGICWEKRGGSGVMRESE